jgi:hypothetical protein
VIGMRQGWPAGGPVVVVAVLALLVLAGCGGHSSSQRVEVARYVVSVNRVELSLRAPLMTVNRIAASVSGRHQKTLSQASGAVLERRLATAVTSIRVQERRLRAIPAPRPATHLRALLVRYTTGSAALTAQLGLLVGFLPRFSAVLAPLGPALGRLEAALSVHSAAGTAAVSAVYAAKARALRAFRATSKRIIAQLRRLTPPPVSRPAYRAQLTSLRGMGTSAGHLADALAGGAPGNVTPFLVAFDRAALATRSRSAQKAEIAAVRAYDAQSTGLATLQGEIERERLRLAGSLR